MLSWPTPNYDNPVTLGNGLLVSSLVLGITATLLVAARLYTKAFVLRQPGADDVLVVVGLVRNLHIHRQPIQYSRKSRS
jgi:hypothetical protein